LQRVEHRGVFGISSGTLYKKDMLTGTSMFSII